MANLLGESSTPPSSEAPSSLGPDLDDLQRILEEEDNNLPLEELTASSITADRRAELDELLQQADILSRAGADSPIHEAEQRDQSIVAEESTIPSTPSHDAPASTGEVKGQEVMSQEVIDGSTIETLKPVSDLQTAEAAERRTLTAGSSGGRHHASHVTNSSMHALKRRGLGLQQQLQQQQWSTVNPRDSQRGLALLHVSPLDNMSSELTEQHERGRPTAIALHQWFVAVGTSHGHVLVYDRKQYALKAILTMPPPRSSARASLSSSLSSSFFRTRQPASPASPAPTPVDPITALQMSDGETWFVLAGHRSGRLVLWEIGATATVLKDCTDLHEAPIAHLRFLTSNRAQAITVDDSGAAHLTTFMRILMAYSVTRVCLLDGAAGKITAVEVLAGHHSPSESGSATDEMSRSDAAGMAVPGTTAGSAMVDEEVSPTVVALCTAKVTFIIRILPKVDLLQRLQAPGGSPTAPLSQPAAATPDSQRMADASSTAKPTAPAHSPLNPRLAWWTAPILGHVDADASSSGATALLSIAWGEVLQIFRLLRPATGEGRLVNAGRLTCRSTLCGLAWLHDGILLVLDIDFCIQAIDPASFKVIESVMLPAMLCPPSLPPPDELESMPSSSLTGSAGTISNETAATYGPNSLCCDGRTLYMFGGSNGLSHEISAGPLLMGVRAVSWLEWLIALEKAGRHIEAFSAACELFESALTAGSLPIVAAASACRSLDEGNELLASTKVNAVAAAQSALREAVANLACKMLFEFAAKRLQYLQKQGATDAPHGTDDEALQHKHTDSSVPDYDTLAAICVDLCVSVRRLDHLFGPLYKQFCDVSPDARRALIEAFEPLVRARRLSHFTDQVLIDVCHHFASMGALERLEGCLLALDVTSANRTPLQPLLKVTQRLGLLSAYTRASNLAKRDYLSPLVLLLNAMRCGELDAESSEEGGPLMDETVGQGADTLQEDVNTIPAEEEVWAREIDRRIEGLPTANLSVDATQRRAIGYKLLLYLRHCFTGYAFPTGDPLPPDEAALARQQTCAHLYDLHRHRSRLRLLLELDAHAALGVLAIAFDAVSSVDATEASTGSPTMLSYLDAVVVEMADVDADAHFARTVIEFFLASGSHANSLVPDHVLLRSATNLAQQAANVRAEGDGQESTSDERLLKRLLEQSMVGLELPHGLSDGLMAASAGGRLPRVCAALHTRAGRPAQALACCLDDTLKHGCHGESVDLATAAMLDTALQPAARAELTALVLQRVAELDAIHRNATVVLLRTAFDGEHELLLTKLDTVPRLKLAYLHSLLPGRGGRKAGGSESAFGDGLATLPPVDALSVRVHDAYLELLCAHAPSEVRGYLEAHDEYGLDASLKVTQAHGCDEGMAYLLERTGDLRGAMRLTLSALGAALGRLQSRGPAVTEAAKVVGAALVVEAVDRAAELCERSGAGGNRAEAQWLWLELLDTVVGWQLETTRALSTAIVPLGPEARELSAFGERLTRRVARRMALAGHGHEVALRHIFEAHDGTLCDVRALIGDALYDGNAQASVLRAARATCDNDVAALLKERHAVTMVGRAPTEAECRRQRAHSMRRATPAPVEDGSARRISVLEAGRIEEGEHLAEHWERILSATAKAVAEAEAAAGSAEHKGTTRMLPSLSKWMGGTNATNGGSAGGASSNGNVFIRCGSFGSDTTVAGATTGSGGGSVTGSSAGNVGSSRAGPGRLAGGLPPPECTRELDVGSWMEH